MLYQRINKRIDTWFYGQRHWRVGLEIMITVFCASGVHQLFQKFVPIDSFLLETFVSLMIIFALMYFFAIIDSPEAKPQKQA
ncbi:MAG: hypothetical protein LKF36_09090 [Lactobacillus sp.]|jgi:hypothetical protein|nr:hypothetical protein [Lactobacillus sp.]